MLLYLSIFLMSGVYGGLLHILAALLPESGQCATNRKVAGSIAEFGSKTFH